MNYSWTWGQMNVLGANGLVDEDRLLGAWNMLLEFFLDGANGRQEGDEVFEYVTETRQSQNSKRRRAGSPELPYSCCTDLAFSMLFALVGGDMDQMSAIQKMFAKQVINRDEFLGWRSQVAVSLLRYKTGDHFKVLRGTDWSPPPVSIALIGEHGAEHIMVPRSVSDKQVVSDDYGQFWSKNKNSPGMFGGCRRTRELSRRNGRLWAGSNQPKPVIGHVDVVSWLNELIRLSPRGEWLVRIP